MADQDVDHLWLAIFGIFTINALWTAYLEYRNIREFEKPLTPPPALKLSTEELNVMATRARQESSEKLVTTMAQFWIQSLQFLSNYYPYVWQLSGKLYGNMTARAMWFAALDQTMSALLRAVAQRPHPPSPESVLESIAIRAPAFALYTLLRIKIFENFGSTGLFLVINIGGVAFEALILSISLQGFEYRPLIDDDLGRSVKALATKVGYPLDRIFIIETQCCPGARYYNFILSKWIRIARTLTYIMDVPEVVGVVARELGHWKYCHRGLTDSAFLILSMFLFFLSNLAYGNSKLLLLFRLPDAHPVLGDLLALQFIGIPFVNIFTGCVNLMHARHELTADDYACGIWDPKNVRDGQLKLYWFYKPRQSESLHAAWYTGYPAVAQRVLRIESHIPSK